MDCNIKMFALLAGLIANDPLIENCSQVIKERAGYFFVSTRDPLPGVGVTRRATIDIFMSELAIIYFVDSLLYLLLLSYAIFSCVIFELLIYF